MKLINQNEIQKMRKDFLVKPMFPLCGAYTIFAGSGVGKTTLASQLIKSVLKHQPFLGMETNPNFKSKVCYIALEMSEKIYQVNYFDVLKPTFMLELNNEELEKFEFVEFFENNTSTNLINKLEELKEYKLIVIDLVSYVSDYSEISKDSGRTGAFFRKLNEIAQANSQYFICLAHTLKDKRTFSGQETLIGAVSGQYVLYTKSPEENEFALATDKIRYEKNQGELFLKQLEDRTFTVVDTIEVNIPNHLNLIQGALRSLKKPKTGNIDKKKIDKSEWICPNYDYLFDEEVEWCELDINYLINFFKGEKSNRSIGQILINQKNQKMLSSNGLIIAVHRLSSHHNANVYYFHFLPNNYSSLNEQNQDEVEKNTTLEKSNELFDNSKVEVVPKYEQPKYEQQSFVVDNNYSLKEKEVQ